jgi:hypothetical protein
LIDVDVQARELGVGAGLIVRDNKNTVLEEKLENLAAHAGGHPHEKRTAITADSEQTLSIFASDQDLAPKDLTRPGGFN